MKKYNNIEDWSINWAQEAKKEMEKSEKPVKSTEPETVKDSKPVKTESTDNVERKLKITIK